MNIIIFGVGALGCLYGSRLNEVVSITMVGQWPEQLAHIQQHGLTVTHLDGTKSTHRLKTTNNLYDVPWADVVLVLVKSYQTERIATQIVPLLKPNGVVITLQNGLGNREILEKVILPRQVTVGITAQGATMLAPGHVRHAGNGPTHIATHATITTSRLQPLATLFEQAHLQTTLVDDVSGLIWGKLAINAAINPLTALLECPNGKLATHPELSEMMGRAAYEVAAVATAQGITLPYEDAAQQALNVSQATATNRSSMLQDIDRGSQTEIEAICGAVVRYGAQVGVATPVNQWLWAQVKQKEVTRQPISQAVLVAQIAKLQA